MRAHAGAAAACIDPSAVPSGFGGVDATSDRSRESEGATARNTVVMADPRRVADANGTCDANGMQRTQYPYVTGTSVLALKFKGGVMIAADTLGSYGATKRYKSVPRVRDVGSHMVIGAGGELSDYNYIMSLLDELMTDEFCYDDGTRRLFVLSCFGLLAGDREEIFHTHALSVVARRTDIRNRFREH